MNTNHTPTPSMKLPVDLSHTTHRHGGRIVRIERIEHVVDKPEDGRSRDVWHFIGNVEWSDGTRSDGLQIAPWAVCFDGDHRDEVIALNELMSEYLNANGDWFRSGPHEGWYAHRPRKARVALAGSKNA